MAEDLLPAPLAPELSPVVSRAPDRLPAAVYLARLAPGSRRTLRGALDTLAALLTGNQADALTCPWHLLRYPHTQALRAALAERYAPATANKHLAALRGVLQEAWRLGLVDGESYHRAVDLAGVRGTTLPAGRALAAAEIRALFEACADGTPGGARDAAMLALLYGSMLRRSEAVALDLADYDPAAGALRVKGKGRKERMSYLPAGGRAAVDAWLAVRGGEPGPLLCPVRKGGLVRVRRLSDQAVLYATRKRQQQAPGVAPFSPHDLRRTSIGDLLDAGADLAAVQRLAGHAQVNTTTRYDRRPEAVKRKAAELLQVPFVNPGQRRGPPRSKEMPGIQNRNLTRADIVRGYNEAAPWTSGRTLPDWWIKITPGGAPKGLREVGVNACHGENIRTPNRDPERACLTGLGCTTGQRGHGGVT